jgi:hypothetical protein
MNRSINNVSENIAQDIYICIDKMKSKKIKSLTNRRREYGIDIVVEDTSNQIISIAVSSSSRGIGDVKGLNIIVELLVSFEPPFFPWNRIKYNGNIELKMQIEESVEDFLKKMQFNYLIESA